MDSVYVIGRDAVPSFLRLAEGESLRMTLVVPEGESCRLSLEVDLDGPGASLDLAGASLSSGGEQVEISVVVRHNVPGCRSEQLFKSVVGGSAKVSFNGLVYVAQDAVRTVAHQQNHSLLLSETAVAESRPQLEIYADDVECSHGATTGYLNPEELFYMRSRGIPEDEARRMQVEAFLAPVLLRAGIDEADTL
ncbi:MAG: SufD family Fe-S cluster assembly protein [Bacteroidales bacterium]|nr:SufD family Fe-S cluster assembly protein [Bacteroidales bacterium]